MDGSPKPNHDQAVVVCTRNRPTDVASLLDSLASRQESTPLLVLLVDASDAEFASQVRAHIAGRSNLEVQYLAFPDKPSLARQRNYGVANAPESVNVIHFLDDDVTLEPGYIETLKSTLDRNPDIGGVGGRVLESGPPRPSGGFRRLVSRIFLLESGTPGKVLPSGGLTGAQSAPLEARLEVECLGGCASYRRELVDRLQFDPRLEGYSMDEDLDFSYRASRITELIVEPSARLVHHLSPSARHSIRESRRDLLVHRYWFVEKNIRHPLRKPAFWWKIFGSYLMASLSRNADAVEARKGILDGVAIVWRRSHPLLRSPVRARRR